MKSEAQAGKLRTLNRPRPVQVVASDHGAPTKVHAHGRMKQVEAILETWRIDDEWWREAISRTYYSLLLEGGRHLTVYHDLVEGRWYSQPQ
jgi:hypothetical protein